MRPAPALLLLLSLGCPEARLGPVSGGVAPRESGLEFPRTFVGRTRSLPLRLANTSSSARSVRLRTGPPFSAPAAVQVEPGATQEVELQFRPVAPGDASGTLEVEADGQPAATVPLAGLGALAPACAPSGPCLQADLDPDSGACVETPAGESQACASACISGGQCRAGTCVGTLLDCDDHDPYTTDACDPAKGCLHLPACPASADPCQVSSCDPVRSCSLAPAADGTACGPSDCQSARVCMAGACVSRPVPEGAACGEPSPCQPRGVCTAGACVRGPKQPLVPVWSVAPPDGGWIGGGPSDADGNFYVTAGLGQSAWLVSLSADGFERYRVPLEGFDFFSLLTEGLVVLDAPTGLRAYWAADGGRAWSRDFEADLGLHQSGYGPAVEGLAADGQGRLYLSADYGGVASGGGFVAALSTHDGSLLWLSDLADQAWDLAGDEQGRLHAVVSFLSTGVATWSSLLGYLDALDDRGRVLWRARSDLDFSPQNIWWALGSGSNRLSAAQGVLLASGGQGDDGGATLVTFGSWGSAMEAALPASAGSPFSPPVVLIGADGPLLVGLGLGGPAWLYRVNPLTGQVQAVAQFAHAQTVGSPQLTDRGSVLVVTEDDGGARFLEELMPGGLSLLDCPLPAGVTGGALRRGHWVASGPSYGALQAYDLGTLDVAPHGWVTDRANPEHTNFAR